MRRKKKNKSQNVPATPLPPMPGMPLPPLAGEQPLPGAPLPPLPTPQVELPIAPVPVPQPLPEAPAITPSVPQPAPPLETPSKDTNEYGDLWAKRSAKPLPQIYGAIDRLGSGEAGSLLDRYSDRFGHSLDRDIIVLRKKEREEALNEIRSEPVVELLDEEEPDRLSEVENELRSLKPNMKQQKPLKTKHLSKHSSLNSRR